MVIYTINMRLWSLPKPPIKRQHRLYLIVPTWSLKLLLKRLEVLGWVWALGYFKPTGVQREQLTLIPEVGGYIFFFEEERVFSCLFYHSSTTHYRLVG